MTLGNNLLLASLSQLSTIHLGLTATLIIILVAQYVTSPWRKLPPGPKGLPTLGNAFQLQDKGWMFESECKRKFGPSNLFFGPSPRLFGFTIKPSEHMMYLNAFGQSIIVLNNLKVAFELLDKRAHIYSDRPRCIVGFNILCGSLFMGFMTYGDVLVYYLL